jgi:OOP family OmpA-OmpF porin
MDRIGIRALAVVLALGVSGWAEEARRNMTITYADGSTQVIALTKSSSQIARIDFSGGQQGATYNDAHGTQVYVPCGRLAFAGRVVESRMGNPAAVSSAQNPAETLGEPNFSDARDSGYTTLGCGGSIVLEFTQVRLVDVDGPDLYIFEVGADVEPTQLEISKDGQQWITIGRISGGKTSVDIRPYVQPGDQFRYIRLTDLKSACGGNWPGADIDAVAAIGCVRVN